MWHHVSACRRINFKSSLFSRQSFQHCHRMKVQITTGSKLMMRILILELIFVNVLCARTLPTVKPGLFVIHGVHTCGGGDGFCLMGSDCTVNEEFLPDEDGHCAGLRSAFIPESHFSCCRYVPNNATFDEFGTDPPTSTLSDDISPTDSVGSLNENSGHSERHSNSNNVTEKTPQVNRISQVKQEDTQPTEPSPVLEESHSETIDIPASVDNTLHLGSTNHTVASSSNSTSFRFPGTGSIDLGHQPTESDSTHSLQLLAQSEKSGQKQHELDEFSAEDLEPRGVTNSEVGIEINHLGCNHDIHTDSDLPAFEHIENLASSRPNESLVSRDYAKDINDHKHEQSPAQWFRISRKLGQSRPTEMTLLNSLDESQKETNESVIVLTVPEELKRVPLTTPPEHCRSFPNAEEDVPRCMSVWKFMLNGAILCFGTLINSIWVLTSASCITKIYDRDMEVVMVSDVEENSGLHKISTMIVHENYKAGNQNELNNVGLISLDSPTDSSCFVCFSNEEAKYSDRSCSTYVLTSRKINDGSLEKCEDRVKVLNMYSKLYLSLLCPSNEDFRQLVDNSTGNILWCEDTLVGIETSYLDGQFLFTPAFEHADWIQKNIQQYL